MRDAEYRRALPGVSVARRDERPERGGFGDIVPCVFTPVLVQHSNPNQCQWP